MQPPYQPQQPGPSHSNQQPGYPPSQPAGQYQQYQQPQGGYPGGYPGGPAYTPRPATSSNKGCWIAGGIVGGILLLLLLTIGGCSLFVVNRANATQEVEVIATSTGVSNGSISFYGPNSQTENVSAWNGSTETRRYKLKRYESASVYVHSSYRDSSPSVSCEIKVNGKSVKTDTSSTMASCYYYPN